MAALLSLVGLGVVGSVTGATVSHRAATATTATAPVDAATLVCPDLSGRPGGTTTTVTVADLAAALAPPSRGSGTVSTTPLTGSGSRSAVVRPSPVVTLPSHTGTANAVTVSAAGSVAATLVADQVALTDHGRFRALTGARCEPPASDWWFSGADGRVGYDDTLVVSNPATSDAEVSVAMWSSKGPLAPPHLDALRVPALSRVLVGIAAVAPDAAQVTVHVHATSGAVTAALVDRRMSGLSSGGADWLPPTRPPARSLLVGGYPGGSGGRYLFVAAPGGADATVSIRLVTTSGAFAPAGADHVVVHAGQTSVVDLTKPMSGATGGVSLTSDQPVVAQGLSVAPARGKLPDLSWQAAGSPLSGGSGVANGTEPDGGSCLLLLTAPLAAAQVRVSVPGGGQKVLSVPAGHSLSADVTSLVGGRGGPHPFTVTPLGPAPVYATRVLTFQGAHGALQTAEPVAPLPRPLVLPAVREDPRVALG